MNTPTYLHQNTYYTSNTQNAPMWAQKLQYGLFLNELCYYFDRCLQTLGHLPWEGELTTINVSRMSPKLLRTQPHTVEIQGITMAPLLLSLTS